ncbi:MAG TPA: choice-of-anchor D domain-containing protein, partial [Myxococcota bacterium]|nr:choice-of-anchor D domain-containing protein [Myxococcota bacterium]
MLRKASVLWLAGFVLLLGTLACECDGGGNLTDIWPKLEKHFVGQEDVTPALEQYVDVPGSETIALDFGLTDVDIANSRYLFLRNTGNGDLHMAGLTLADGSSGDFAPACLEGGQFRLGCPYDDTHTLVVPAGQDLVLRVTYAPRDVGADAGSFVIHTDAHDHPALTVTLAGEGVTPEVQVCVSDCTGDQAGAGCAGAGLVCNDALAPANLEVDFGDTDMSTAVGRDMLIRNLGDRPLSVSGLVFISGAHSQFSLEVTGGQALPGVLPAGQEAVVHLVFDPGLGGEHQTTLQVQSNDVNEREINLVLSGRGLAPRVCPEPMALDFGNVPTGQSLEQSFVITNCGLLELQLEGLSLAASTSADFSLTGNPAPTALAVGAQATVTVRYWPQAQGSDRGGVEIFSNDPASDPVSHLTGAVSLVGQSVPRQCQIQATPFAVTFGGVVQQQSATVNLVISNQGSDLCTLQSVEISANTASGEFALDQVPPAGSELQPGDSLVAVVRYSPVDLGVDTGTLSIFGNDADGNEVRVDLNGEGIQAAVCDLEVNPDSLNFGTVKVNTTATQVVQLTNVGQAQCSITQLELKQSAMFPGNFTITAGPSAPFVLNRRGQPNSQASVEITYAPDTVSQDEVLKQSAALRITCDDPDLQLQGGSMWDVWACLPPPTLGQACVPVSGMSVESAIEVVPSELDFGVVEVGCNSPELHVTVYNLGTEALNIQDMYLETQPDPNFEIRQAPALPYNLAGGGSFQVRLRYHPQEDRAHRNNLIITSDASNAQMLAVPLFGRGTLLSHQTDVFHQPTEVKSDVLFV